MTLLQTQPQSYTTIPPQAETDVFLFDDPVTGGSVLIGPGWLPAGFTSFLRSSKVRQWAILSAADAHGLHLGDAENERRHRALYRHLRLSGYEPTTVWSRTGTKAWLVPGIALDEAKRFGFLFAQGRVLAGDSLTCRYDACEPQFFDI